MPSWNAALDEHNEYIIEQWNKNVKPHDEVWVVGDAIMGVRAETIKLAQRLYGTLHLISGNHDHTWSGNHHKSPEKAAVLKELYEQAFIIEDELIYGDVMGLDSSVIATHFPWAGTADHEDSDREHLEKFYPKREDYPVGTVLLHGHTHSSRYYQVPMAVHVGIDANGGEPLPLDLVQHLIEGARLNGLPE